MIHIPLKLITSKYNQLVCITDRVEKAAEESGIREGFLTVLTKHTTTGIMVNESLECVESDILDFLSRYVPEDYPYAHGRMLRSYGSTAGNPSGHIKSMLAGNHCHFPIVDGRLIRGDAQNIYFCEFDGPAERTILIVIQGF
jgi:secondary thiamine-phosphate synthase enzyme